MPARSLVLGVSLRDGGAGSCVVHVEAWFAAITAPGSAHLAENQGEAEAALTRLDELRTKSEVVDAGPVFRAMSNLKTVLQQRLSALPEKELLFSVADLIDEAARKIERL